VWERVRCGDIKPIHPDEPEVHRSFRCRGDFVDYHSGCILVTGETWPSYANFITDEFWAGLHCEHCCGPMSLPRRTEFARSLARPSLYLAFERNLRS
jgi:hypothetical protein